MRLPTRSLIAIASCLTAASSLAQETAEHIQTRRLDAFFREQARLSGDLSFHATHERLSAEEESEVAQEIEDTVSKWFEDREEKRFPTYLDVLATTRGWRGGDGTTSKVRSRELTIVGERAVQRTVWSKPTGREIGTLVDGDLRMTFDVTLRRIAVEYQVPDPGRGIGWPGAVMGPLSPSDEAIAELRGMVCDAYTDETGRFDVLRWRHEFGGELTYVFEREAAYPFLAFSALPDNELEADELPALGRSLLSITAFHTASHDRHAELGSRSFPFTDVIRIMFSPKGAVKVDRYIINRSQVFDSDEKIPLPRLVVQMDQLVKLVTTDRQTGGQEAFGTDHQNWPEEILKCLDVRK